jgi:hypothetical protein
VPYNNLGLDSWRAMEVRRTSALLRYQSYRNGPSVSAHIGACGVPRLFARPSKTYETALRDCGQASLACAIEKMNSARHTLFRVRCAPAYRRKQKVGLTSVYSIHRWPIVAAPRLPIAPTFDTLGDHFEINPTLFIDLRRIALRRSGRLLCR